jgi:hypothetical protein
MGIYPLTARLTSVANRIQIKHKEINPKMDLPSNSFDFLTQIVKQFCGKNRRT